eukprot:Plantae.Rhodophyta-Rhodochaete_pulchella.ctg25093.p2 GENE.Plantae.Rhodophyta-Rhodochaete_pulchella.ctg25093~~Plantae.Rhodophyta-Rhodochaete_pulchella.ctg25093.p2  ORF type:complete len:146 (+),score=20.39 Plantae.Rhodophyta-Rhodochaete_pulchella.ctg25093:219-656(+)
MDLQRASVAIAQARNLSQKPAPGAINDGDIVTHDPMSRATGDVYMRSRLPLFAMWRRRYASVVDHAYFGPVLFLFKYDNNGAVACKHSAMVALDDCDVSLGRNSRDREGRYKMEFSLKTERRKYTFATVDNMKREYWIEHLRSIS